MGACCGLKTGDIINIISWKSGEEGGWAETVKVDGLVA